MDEPQTIKISPKTVEKDRRAFEKYVAKRFSRRIGIIRELSDSQLELTDLFLHHLRLKNWFGYGYSPNQVLYNLLLNQPTMVNSGLLLLRNGYFGSTRLIIRQNFEMLLIAKYAEIDPNLIKRWQSKKEGRDKINDINLTSDVFNKLNQKVKTDKLKEMWALLCSLSHATTFAQQPVINYPKKEASGNWHHTLDLLFMSIQMSLHATNLLHAKAKGFYQGYPRDPYGDYIKINGIKNRIKELTAEYYLENKKEKVNSGKFIGPVIMQYRSKWV